jgi:hypothetical protein
MSTLSRLLKGAARSNTVQFNVASLFLLVLDQAMKLDFITQDPDRMAIAAGVMALVNLVLRVKTKKPLTER